MNDEHLWFSLIVFKLKSRLKEEFIMLSTDGPGRNVLKFKPPLCFNTKDAKLVVEKLDKILRGKNGEKRSMLD